MTLPAEYQNAQVRCVLPRCPERERLGLAFGVGAAGHAFRVAVTHADALFLLAALNDYLGAGSQSPVSREIPMAPKSVPSDGENV